jgi:hypothetical protein
MIKAILLSNNQIIISQSTPKVDDETGEAYFSIMYPYLFTLGGPSKIGFHLTPWMGEVADPSEEFMIYPDKVITIRTPKPEVLKLYKKLIIVDEVEDNEDNEGDDEVFEEEIEV